MKLQITIDGKAYPVDVEILDENEVPQLSIPPAQHAGQAAGGHTPIHAGGTWDACGKVCSSPVMGLVITVNVAPGQAVDAGSLLIVLEAMKMETHITAPHSGTLKSVHVAQGGPVKVGQLLVEFE